MVDISLVELGKVPYLDISNLHGRTIHTLTFFETGQWHFWLPVGSSLIRMQAVPAESLYFARSPNMTSDVQLDFLELIVQRASWPSIVPAIAGLRNDFLNLSASLKKFEILFEQSKMLRVSASRLVITEIEYFFSLCRSVFDLLQEVVFAQWETIKLFDDSIKKRELPKTFSRMALTGNRGRDVNELIEKFNIPAALADFYVRSTPFFKLLRAFRDGFIHRGATPDLVHVTERGFAVPSSTLPFSEFGVWSQAHKLPNDLCSLRPALAYMVKKTLLTCDDYSRTMQEIVQYPPPIAPGFSLYLRGHFTGLLNDNERVLAQCQWWDED